MKYTGMPAGMWKIFKKSFRKALVTDLGYDAKKASEIMKKACPRYKEIIGKLPEFEKEDRFKTNILSCAMFVSVLLSVYRRPTLQEATDYYEHAMTTKATKWFCKRAGKTKFSEKDIEAQKKTAAFRAGDRNPYSWNMEYLPYEDGSGYEARFTTCGICVLMREYGFGDLIPAMCHLDYTMSKMGGASEFVREYTLAGGGPYCDCGYKKKFAKREFTTMKKAVQLMKKKAFIKDELDKAVPKEQSDYLWKVATKKLNAILNKYGELPKGVQSHTDSIFPAAAVYLTVKRKCGNDLAYSVIENAAINLCAKAQPTLAKIMRLPGLASLFVKVWDPMTKKKFGPDSGFNNRFYPKKKGEYRMDILACPYFRYFSELGCPELTKIYCENDERMYGNLPGLKFERTGTIGKGSDHCDFYLRRVKG